MPRYSSEGQGDEPDAASIPGSGTNGGMAGMLAALTMLVLVAVAAFWLIGTQKPAGRTVAAREIEQAAKPDEAAARRGQEAPEK